MNLAANVIATQSLMLATVSDSDEGGDAEELGAASTAQTQVEGKKKRSKAKQFANTEEKIAEPLSEITIEIPKDANAKPIQKTVHYDVEAEDRLFDPQFSWDKPEDEPGLIDLGYESHNDYENLRICECCGAWNRLQQWQKAAIIILALNIVFGAPGLVVYLLGLSESTRFLTIRLDMWSLWAVFVFSMFGVVYFAVLVTLALFQLSRSMSRSLRLRMAVALRLNIIVALWCCLNLVSYCVLSIIYEGCSYSSTCTGASFMFPVLLSIFIASMAFLLEQYLVKTAAINFHQYAYRERIQNLQFVEWALDFITSARRRKKPGSPKKSLTFRKRGLSLLKPIQSPVSQVTSMQTPATMLNGDPITSAHPTTASYALSELPDKRPAVELDPSLPPPSQFLADTAANGSKDRSKKSLNIFQLIRNKIKTIANQKNAEKDPWTLLAPRSSFLQEPFESDPFLDVQSTVTDVSSVVPSSNRDGSYLEEEFSLESSSPTKLKRSEMGSAVNLFDIKRSKSPPQNLSKEVKAEIGHRNVAFKTIKTKIKDAGMLEALTSLSEATYLAKKNFEFLAKGKEFVETSDVEQYFKGERLHIFMQLFDSNGNGIISKREFKGAVIHFYRERLVLTQSLLSTKNSLSKLDWIFTIITVIILIFVTLAVFNYNVYSLFLTMTSIIIPLTFIIGNSAKTLFEAVIFLFVSHPFDVGDKVQVDSEHYIVLRIHILTTLFTRISDGAQVTIPNAVLSVKAICNFKRSSTLK